MTLVSDYANRVLDCAGLDEPGAVVQAKLMTGTSDELLAVVVAAVEADGASDFNCKTG